MNRFFTFRVVIVALIIWVGLCLLIAASIFLLPPFKVINVVPTAVITVVYAPTPAPTSIPVAIQINNPPGSTPAASLIKTGDYVQITGTGGEGLRIRSAPGIENNQLFIANEAEGFDIKDGPVTAGDYTWWYLVSPKDKNRYGWAAGNFLVVTARP